MASSTFSGPVRSEAGFLNGSTTATLTATATAGAATLSQPAGVVTSEAITTAAAAAYTLTITNTLVTTSSIVMASVSFGTSTTGVPLLSRVTPTANTITVVVQNGHASAAFNGTIKVAFVIVG
jgi:hypothetical protein